MATKVQLIEDQNWLSERVSSRVWAAATAVLAMCLAIFLEKDSTIIGTSIGSYEIFIPAVFALGSMLADLIQYFAGYVQTTSLIAEVETNGSGEGVFKRDTFLYKLRSLAFWGKAILALIAFCWLAYLLGKVFLEG